MPDILATSETQSTTSDSWFMLNTEFLGIKVHSGTNFVPTPFTKPKREARALNEEAAEIIGEEEEE
jgi:predicted  nucleic acid-binding Zn ribbon protein